MNYLAKFSIKSRMFSLFAVWIILFIGFSIFTISEMHNMGSVVGVIYEHPLEISKAANEARVEIIKIQRGTRDAILAENDIEFRNEIENLKPLKQSIIYNLDAVRNLAQWDSTKQYEGEVRALFEQWNNVRNEALGLAEKGDRQGASELLKEKSVPYVDIIEQKLIQIDENAKLRAAELVQQAEDINNNQRNFLITAIVIICIVFFIIFMLMSNSILYPIATLKKVMNEAVDAKQLEPVVLPGKNEIVEMSEYYNALVKRLKNQFWIKDSQNLLSEELSGATGIEEYAQRAVTFLARSLGAGKAVFYLYDERVGQLKLKAAFAFTEKEKVFQRVSIGEGIIGQVALERKPVLLKNINLQEERISTGTINGVPLNTYTFPLEYEDKLYGVVELASFLSFEQDKTDFIKATGDVISINLFSLLQNEKVRELLQISERAHEEARISAGELKKANDLLFGQKELLQQQAEELQQTNAELEEQHQLLQQQSEELQQTNTQLEEQQQQLEEHAMLLDAQNRELEESRLELTKRSDELSLTNKYKSEFLANMSHELRTPLNSIILLSKLLMNRGKGCFEEKDMEKIDIINNSGNELLRLINDVLDLSKVEAGRMSLELSYFHSGKISHDLQLMFDGMAKEKNLKLIIEDTADILLYGDEYKVSQILRNLLSNAVKFTEIGCVTFLTARIDDTNRGILFTVKDTGIGIPPERVSGIFDEFQQVDGSISRKYGGTGLGLSISKKLAELMGGEIQVKSTAGEGSEFSLFVPDLIAETESKVENADFRKLPEIARVPKGDKSILVIEDDNGFIEYIRNIIIGMGFYPIIAKCGRDGVKLAREHRPDGILLDLGLPDINGIEVLRELKSITELRNIPIHIISVSEKTNKAQKMGAIGYEQKPVDETEIVTVISRMIAFTEKNPKHLLLIEDNYAQQEVIKELLYSDDLKVRTVDTEDAARLELQRERYDVVVLDLELKEGSGINVCRFLEEKNLEVPVIVYTGRDLTVEQEKQIRKVADRIIIKTAHSIERFLDEVTLFLHKVKKPHNDHVYLVSRTLENRALSLEEKKILIVDDDIRNLVVLTSALEEYKAKIIESQNGRRALEILENEAVDLILMDIMMPEMDGYETIKAIRHDPKLNKIPIIAVTAKALKEDRERCIAAGADDYISKPIDYDNLIRLVNAWLKNS